MSDRVTAAVVAEKVAAAWQAVADAKDEWAVAEVRAMAAEQAAGDALGCGEGWAAVAEKVAAARAADEAKATWAAWDAERGGGGENHED